MISRGKAADGPPRAAERGAALIVALLVMVIMTLLGIPFLLMGETENRIAENERLSLQALYAAESGARVVKRWFDHPGASNNLINPPLAAIVRDAREIDEDGDPGTAPVSADGSPAHPYYKQDDDAFFDKPYRGSLVDALLGTEAGPDMTIDEAGPVESRDFLRDLSEKLFATYPSAGAGRKARISRIDLYAPPYVEVGGVWKRYGVGTAKVTARIYQGYPGSSDVVLAERVVKIVLNEIRYAPGDLGAVNSCATVVWNDDITVHWGAFITTGSASFDLANPETMPVSLPRVIPPSPFVDMLWGFDAAGDTTGWDAYYGGILVPNHGEVEDPWFRFLSGNVIQGAGADDQPWPFEWTVAGPLEDGTIPYTAPALTTDLPGVDVDWEGTRSNYVQNLASVGCPDFDYAKWKDVAQNGGDNIHYYVWDSALGGDNFQENGEAPSMSFRDHTNGKTGLFFFDTKDGAPPGAGGGNLTPPIEVVGGHWGVTGMVFLNTERFHARDASGYPTNFRAPGEPYQDQNGNGVWDDNGAEAWIDLHYAADLDADLDGENDAGLYWIENELPGSSVHDARGPTILVPAMVNGVLYNSGTFDSRGNGNYYGAIVAVRGIVEFWAGTETPHVYWNEDLRGEWPPADWGLPRVLVSGWETDL